MPAHRSLCLHALTAIALVAGLQCGWAATPKEFRLPRDGGPPWREVVTEHFVFETDLPDASIHALAEQVENARNVMVHMAFVAAPPSGPKIRVIALPDWDFRSFQGGDFIGLFVQGRWYEPVLVTGTRNERGSPALDLVTHELGHAVANQFIPTRNQPRWFAEGIASYLETARFVASSGSAYLGMPPKQFQSGPDVVPFAELWAWGDMRDDRDAMTTARRYRTSWAMLHLLIDTRRTDFDRYAAALTTGEDAHAAWRRIFPDLEGAGADKAIESFLHPYRFDAASYGVKKTQLAKVEVHPAARALDDADVRGVRGLLHVLLAGHSGSRSEKEDMQRARAFVEAALKDDPASLWPELVSVRYFGGTLPSVASAKRATETHPDDWLAWLGYEQSLRAAGAAASERRAALDRAGSLAPNTDAVERALQAVEHDASSRAPAEPEPSNQ